MSGGEEMQALIRYRLDQADDALRVGRLALDAGAPRDAANRAYYAMFYAVLALLCLRGERPTRHTHAIGLFDLRFVKEHVFDKEFSAWLHEAFDLRQRADYREMVVIAPERAKEVLDMAAKFLDETRKYFQDKLT